MKILYIGQYSDGTTSKMRADQLREILCPKEFLIIDTHVPFYKTLKFWRSFCFRFKKGPLIKNINNYIKRELLSFNSIRVFDFIWVDKGVFINKKTTEYLKSRTGKLVHFTPDPAFTYHKSNHFFNSGDYYDFLITTKSFELETYISHFGKDKVILTTQGFDKSLHKPNESARLKEGILFIGHHENEREVVLNSLLELDVKVVLAGIKWDGFVKKHKGNPNLNYFGSGIYGAEYAEQISKAKIAWGAVSKWIPEQHTTRTFEIPACGTALLTEYNKEIASFYNEDEVIFYKSIEELIEKVKYFIHNKVALEEVSKKGFERVHVDGYDYESILRKILKQVL
jgi:spore maturation protein CgeB